MPVLWKFRFVWCGPNSRVPDGWCTLGTHPTRSLRRRSRILLLLLRLSPPGERVPLSLLPDDVVVSPQDPRLSHFQRGAAPLA